MKTLIFTFFALIAGITLSYGQCHSRSVFISSKTHHLDKDGNVKHADEEKAVVEISGATITITIRDVQKMTGTIKSNTCDWSLPYKTGKMVMKIVFDDDNGGTDNVTITIEGKNGQITLLYEKEGMDDDRIRVTADQFKEAA